MPHLRREWLRRTERSTLSVSHVLRRKRRKWAISRRPQQCIAHRTLGGVRDRSGGHRCSAGTGNKGFVALNAGLRFSGAKAHDQLMFNSAMGLTQFTTIHNHAPPSHCTRPIQSIVGAMRVRKPPSSTMILDVRRQQRFQRLNISLSLRCS